MFKNHRQDGFSVLKGVFWPDLVPEFLETLAYLLGEPWDGSRGLIENTIDKAFQHDPKKLYTASTAFGSSAMAQKWIGSSILSSYLQMALKIEFRHLHFLPMHVLIQMPHKDGMNFDYDWHQESVFYPQYQDIINIWFPIHKPSRKEDGTLCLIPGSHQGGKREFQIENPEEFIQLIPYVNQAEEAKALPIEIDIGDAVVFDANMVHKSLPNLSESPRISGIIRAIDMSKQDKIKCLYKAPSYDLMK